jgi:hypothetical protein
MTDGRFEPLVTNLRAAWARAYVRIFAASREPSWILTETLLPVIGMCAYVFVYRALGAPRAFEAFVVLGGRDDGLLARRPVVDGDAVLLGEAGRQPRVLLMAPCSRMAILSGMAIGGVVDDLDARAVGAGARAVRLPGAVRPGAWLDRAGGIPADARLALCARHVPGVAVPHVRARGLARRARARGAGLPGQRAVLPDPRARPVGLGGGFDHPAGRRARRDAPAPARVRAAKPILPVATEIWILVGAFFVYLAVAVAMLRWTENQGKKRGTLILRHQ